jgi:prepilin-type N-terminal cleavage/methylation domain-containing protein
MRRSAFSLIELLVVVAIVAAIAGMLLPGLEAMRKSARATRCASNLRQFGMANLAYAEAYEGVTVPSFQNDGAGVSHYNWGWAQMGEFKDLVCDRTGSATLTINGWATGVFCPDSHPSRQFIHWSYGLNTSPAAYGGSAVPGHVAAMRLAAIVRPSALLMFLDGCDGFVGKGAAGLYTGNEGYLLNATAYRHPRVVSARAVMWDGHAQPVQRAELMSSFDPWK